MRWFKYMERKYAEEFANHGIFRINHLKNYENMELLGSAIGDSEENKLTIFSKIGLKTGSELNDFEKDGFFTFENDDIAKTWTFGNVECIRENHGRPTYSFCATDTCSEKIREQFNIDNKLAGRPAYDACVEILDRNKFIEVLKKHMHDINLIYYGHGHCFYREKQIPWNQWNRQNEQCPAFIKDPKYKWQQEVRILFEPRDEIYNDFVDLSSSDFVSLCRLHTY